MSFESSSVRVPTREEQLAGLGINDHDGRFWAAQARSMRERLSLHDELVDMPELNGLPEERQDA